MLPLATKLISSKFIRSSCKNQQIKTLTNSRRHNILSKKNVIYYALYYLLKFNLLILPEERMNFKLSNIPGNSVYIKIDKMNNDILAQIVSDLILDTAKFSLQFDEKTNVFNLKARFHKSVEKSIFSLFYCFFLRSLQF